MKAFYIKTNHNPPLFLGTEEAVFIFMTKELAQARLDVTEAVPQETMRIVEITVEEVI